VATTIGVDSVKIAGTERALGIDYAIRDVVLPARKLEEKGIDVTKLNIGDPLKFDFETPSPMERGVKRALDANKNYYSDSEGVKELRQEIVKRERNKNNAKITYQDVFITNGISEGINMVFGSLLEEGDEVLVPGPTYPPYIALSHFYGAQPVSYRTIEADNWRPDVDDIRDKITDKTKAIVLINPNNPTGALYPKDTVQKILDLAAEHELPLISDEVYDEMTYEGDHTGTASIASEVPLIVFNGFSKVYLAPGWRVGYMYFQDPEGKLDEIKQGVAKMGRVRLCPNTPLQYGALEGLKQEKDYLKKVMDKLEERRDYFHKRINEIEGLSTQKPQGAFYIFPKLESNAWDSDKQFVLDFLKKKHVLFVHGSGFCPQYGKNHFRSVFLAQKNTLSSALNKLEEFMREKV